MARRLRIRGVVQGVGYRAGFARQAQRLGLSGWVRNRLDGSVEALVAGDAAALEQILDWARRGPPAARVNDVEVAEAGDAAAAGGFEVRPTA
ncbi:MAG: acylphosphatase [Noviherbaspirillum sp.]